MHAALLARSAPSPKISTARLAHYRQRAETHLGPPARIHETDQVPGGRRKLTSPATTPIADGGEWQLAHNFNRRGHARLPVSAQTYFPCHYPSADRWGVAAGAQLHLDQVKPDTSRNG